MGSAIAGCVLRGGFDLVVYNRTREKMEPFLAKGAKGAVDLKDAVKDADVVITMLMDDKSVLDSVRMFAGSMKPGAVHVGLATVSPECADEVAKLQNNVLSGARLRRRAFDASLVVRGEKYNSEAHVAMGDDLLNHCATSIGHLMKNDRLKSVFF